jgi:hypothetical protein
MNKQKDLVEKARWYLKSAALSKLNDQTGSCSRTDLFGKLMFWSFDIVSTVGCPVEDFDIRISDLNPHQHKCSL